MESWNLRAHTILLALSGSRAYGMHLPDSDVDVKGVAVPPLWRYLEPSAFEQVENPSPFQANLSPEERVASQSTKLEGSIYELRKFLGLAVQSNPNIWEVLFCREKDIRWCTETGAELRAGRDLFLSRRARWSFGGYAHAQLSRMKGHRQWHTRPPKQPSRANFGLPESTLIPRDQLQAAQAAIADQLTRWTLPLQGLSDVEKIAFQAHLSQVLQEMKLASDNEKWLAAANHIGLDANLILVLQREREYQAAAQQWRTYQKWLAERNPARAALEEACGFDSKHAAHLIRLYRTCLEVLQTGQVHVWREDAEELRTIRTGGWTYEQVLEEAARLEQACIQAEKDPKCPLPAEPDMVQVNALRERLFTLALGVDLRR